VILLWSAAGGVVLGRARGGQLAHLGDLRLRRAWIVLPALAGQCLWVFMPPMLPEHGVDPLRLWLPATLAALVYFALANRHLPGMALVLVGLTCNCVAVAVNGGLMPTNEAALKQAGMDRSLELAQEHPGIRLPRSKDVALAPDDTRLWFLTDTLVSPPLPRRKVFSVGDVFVSAGLVMMLTLGMEGKTQRDTAKGPRTSLSGARTGGPLT
jgi:Family of unknown function (DUF5317)